MSAEAGSYRETLYSVFLKNTNMYFLAEILLLKRKLKQVMDLVRTGMPQENQRNQTARLLIVNLNSYYLDYISSNAFLTQHYSMLQSHQNVSKSPAIIFSP